MIEVHADSVILNKVVNGTASVDGDISAEATGNLYDGISDYTDLSNKPSINSVELIGNKSLNDLGIQPKGDYVVDPQYVHTDNNFTSELLNLVEKTEIKIAYAVPIDANGNIAFGDTPIAYYKFTAPEFIDMSTATVSHWFSGAEVNAVQNICDIVCYRYELKFFFPMIANVYKFGGYDLDDLFSYVLSPTDYASQMVVGMRAYSLDGKECMHIALKDNFESLAEAKTSSITTLVDRVFTEQYETKLQSTQVFTSVEKNKVDALGNWALSPSVGGNATKTNGILFGHIDSGSTATVMTASVDGLSELYDGAMVYLTNGVVTSASGWTLNVNGLGAKPVYNSMASATRITTAFNVAYSMMFVYNSTRVSGGCWDMYYGYNSDNNTLAYNIRRNNSSLKCFTALYRYQICFTKDEEYILPANAVNNKTTTNKVLTTEEFDPFGNIYYYSTTTNIGADASVGSGYMWTQYSGIDLRYAFNEGSTLTANRDVYVVCVPQASGKVKLHTDPITQTLPTTADGLVYIKLGRAYDTYRIALDNNHPVYQFVDGKLKLWVG